MEEIDIKRPSKHVISSQASSRMISARWQLFAKRKPMMSATLSFARAIWASRFSSLSTARFIWSEQPIWEHAKGPLLSISWAKAGFWVAGRLFWENRTFSCPRPAARHRRRLLPSKALTCENCCRPMVNLDSTFWSDCASCCASGFRQPTGR